MFCCLLMHSSTISLTFKLSDHFHGSISKSKQTHSYSSAISQVLSIHQQGLEREQNFPTLGQRPWSSTQYHHLRRRASRQIENFRMNSVLQAPIDTECRIIHRCWLSGGRLLALEYNIPPSFYVT